MVDQRKYVRGSPEQLPLLATRLHMLGHSMQELLEARRNPQAQFLVQELSEDIRDWRVKMQEIYRLLAEDPAAVNQKALRSRLDRKLAQLEVRIKEALNKADEGPTCCSGVAGRAAPRSNGRHSSHRRWNFSRRNRQDCW